MSTDPDHVIRLTAEDILPGPYSEHELRNQWNAQADKHNQWDSLDSSEQLAWAQVRAITVAAELPAAEKLRIVKCGIAVGYNLGHNHTVEYIRSDPDQVADDYAEEVLQDLGNAPAPAVVPVAVSERPPTEEAGDLDRAGRCWWGNAGGGEFVPSWRLCEDPHDSLFTHWRPHHSIPLPQAGEVKT
jgi:hypothetical protein